MEYSASVAALRKISCALCSCTWCHVLSTCPFLSTLTSGDTMCFCSSFWPFWPVKSTRSIGVFVAGMSYSCSSTAFVASSTTAVIVGSMVSADFCFKAESKTAPGVTWLAEVSQRCSRSKYIGGS
jgi:hypothetical protein